MLVYSILKNPEDEGTDGGLNVYRNIPGKQWRRVTGREAVAEDIDAVDLSMQEIQWLVFLIL